MATLNIREIDDEAAGRIKRAAQVRGWTIGQYLARLYELHEAMRALADLELVGSARVGTELSALGLDTYSERQPPTASRAVPESGALEETR
jgi:hypothetical protein